MSHWEIALVAGGLALLVVASLWVQVRFGPYTWYIDALKGSDLGPSHSRYQPLASHDEFLRRLKREQPVIRKRNTVYAQGSRSHHLHLNVDVKRDGLMFEDGGCLHYVTPNGMFTVGSEGRS
jgi:hypothetical protein